MAKKNKFQKKFERGFAMLVNKVMGSGLSQLENEASGEKYVTPGMPEQVRALAEEGIVLLKNDNDALPFKENDNVAVFAVYNMTGFLWGMALVAMSIRHIQFLLMKDLKMQVFITIRN